MAREYNLEVFWGLECSRIFGQSLMLTFENPEAANKTAALLEEAGYQVREALPQALEAITDEEDRVWLSPPRARPERSVGVAIRVLAHELWRPELLKLQVRTERATTSMAAGGLAHVFCHVIERPPWGWGRQVVLMVSVA